MYIAYMSIIHMMIVRNSRTPSPLRYALTKKPGWKWNYYVVVVLTSKAIQGK